MKMKLCSKTRKGEQDILRGVKIVQYVWSLEWEMSLIRRLRSLNFNNVHPVTSIRSKPSLSWLLGQTLRHAFMVKYSILEVNLLQSAGLSGLLALMFYPIQKSYSNLLNRRSSALGLNTSNDRELIASESKLLENSSCQIENYFPLTSS